MSWFPWNTRKLANKRKRVSILENTNLSLRKKVFYFFAVWIAILCLLFPSVKAGATDDVTSSTVGGTWVQEDDTTYTMDKDGDGVADITLVKEGNEWKYYFAVENPNATYYVWEDSELDGYTVSGNGSRESPLYVKSQKGTITNKASADKVGNLYLSKSVSGTLKDTSQLFKFNISLSSDDEEISKILEGSKVYGGVTFKDGEGTCFLKKGQTLKLDSIPAGVNWVIQELDHDGFTVSWVGGSAGSSDDIRTGVIGNGVTTTVTCINTVIPAEETPGSGGGESEKTQSLKVQKNVVSSDQTSDQFSFRMLMSGLQPNKSYTYTIGEDVSGITKYSHTNNVDDKGVKSGGYGNNQSKTEVVTIPGAESLSISITYQTQSTSYDWVCVWKGSHPEYTAYNNYSSSLSKKLGGTTKRTVNYTISGDSVTFGFRSNASTDGYYGYYAVVTGTSSTISYPTDDSGIADITFSLGNGDILDFINLPIGCQYTISEDAVEGYISSYEIQNAVNQVRQKDQNVNTNESLSTAFESIDEGEDATVLFTNTKVVTQEKEKVSVSVEKVWEDNENSLGLRPQYITVYLLQDEDVIYSERLTAENNWSTTFGNLDKYKEDESTEYNYVVKEVSVPGYSTETVRTVNEEQNLISYVITNTQIEVGSLKVSKSVLGEGADTSKGFDFHISVNKDDAPLSGVYQLDSTEGTKTGTIYFDNGSADFTLKDGESIYIKSLPAGAEYTITESVYEDYVVSNPEVLSGSITNGQVSEVNVVNTFKSIQKNSTLSISKEVTGSMGSKSKKFSFTLHIEGDSIPESLDYSKGSITGTLNVDENGDIPFTLAHGETISFSSIPNGVFYTVTENDGESQGYIVMSTNASGVLKEDTQVTFVNNKDMVVPTSSNTNVKIMLLVVGFAFALLLLKGGSGLRKHKKSKN